MRRSLVLTNETARNRFRASLPSYIFRPVDDARQEPFWRLTARDIRGVATTYFATFAATLAFIL
ncbi:hypothetical protein ACRAQ7_14400 [Erythrobacter sp. W53]|uniref:hypothetical protein n=1 Tax=Erythrobacteraceae TaxID=335929 RepID=UPI0036D3344C